MKCLSPEEIQFYLLNLQSKQVKDKIKRHLKECQKCTKILIDLKKIEKLLIQDGKLYRKDISKEYQSIAEKKSKLNTIKSLLSRGNIKESVYLIGKEVFIKRFPNKYNNFENEFEQAYNEIRPRLRAYVQTSKTSPESLKIRSTSIVKQITYLTYQLAKRIIMAKESFSLETLNQTAKEFSKCINKRNKHLVRLVKNVISDLFLKTE